MSCKLPSWCTHLMLQETRTEVLLFLQHCSSLDELKSMFPQVALIEHVPPRTCNSIEVARVTCVFPCGVALPLIFIQSWQSRRFFSARYLIQSIYCGVCLMARLWWSLDRNPWAYVVLNRHPLRRSYRNKARCASLTCGVISWIALVTRCPHPINHKICQIYHRFVEEQFTSLLDEQLRG